MALRSYFDQGLVSISTGSALVTGSGTAFTLAQPNDIFWTIGGDRRILSIESNSALILAQNWSGAPLANSPYEIRITSDTARMQEASRQLMEQLQAGLGYRPDANGTFAGRSAYDAQPAGFIYWQTDVSPFVMYLKNAGVGSWSVGTPVQGAAGEGGAPGADGLGDKYDLVFQDPGRAGDGETVFAAPFATAVNFPTNLAGSNARSAVAATIQANWSLRRNGVQFGTMRFSAGSTVATFIANATQFVFGDELTIVSPNPRDDTLSNVRGVLTGNR